MINAYFDGKSLYAFTESEGEHLKMIKKLKEILLGNKKKRISNSYLLQHGDSLTFGIDENIKF